MNFRKRTQLLCLGGIAINVAVILFISTTLEPPWSWLALACLIPGLIYGTIEFIRMTFRRRKLLKPSHLSCYKCGNIYKLPESYMDDINRWLSEDEERS